MGRTRSKGTQFWSEHVEGYRCGEVSLREYCERHGQKLSTFGRWGRRLCQDSVAPTDSMPPGAINVVRVDVEPVAVARAPSLEVVLGKGRCIRVGNDFEAARLVRVVRTLEGLS